MTEPTFRAVPDPTVGDVPRSSGAVLWLWLLIVASAAVAAAVTAALWSRVMNWRRRRHTGR